MDTMRVEFRKLLNELTTEELIKTVKVLSEMKESGGRKVPEPVDPQEVNRTNP